MKLQRGCVTGLTDKSKLRVRYSIKSNNLVNRNLYFELCYALSVDVLLLLLLLLLSLLLLFPVTECGYCKAPFTIYTSILSTNLESVPRIEQFRQTAAICWYYRNSDLHMLSVKTMRDVLIIT